MSIKRMDHVGIVVDDLAGAIGFFAALGLELVGEWSAQDPAVDRIIGLRGVQTDVAMMQVPDGHGRLELIRFRSPTTEDGDAAAPANVPGLRHVTFAVDDLDATIAALRAHGGELVGEIERFGDTYRLCYLRGPAGVIVELAETVS